MTPFREINASDLSSAKLKDKMDAHGYALIRAVLSQDDLNPLLREITEVLQEAGWLNLDGVPSDRIVNAGAECADGDPLYKCVYDQVFSLQSFHGLPHHPFCRRS
jgi:hypothetical protein